MRLFVGVTDGDWFRHLAAIPSIDEANFRQPSGSSPGWGIGTVEDDRLIYICRCTKSRVVDVPESRGATSPTTRDVVPVLPSAARAWVGAP